MNSHEHCLWQQFLQADPSLPLTLNEPIPHELVTLTKCKNQPDEFARMLTQLCLENDSGNVYLWILLADCCFDNDRIAEARHALEYAKLIDPNNPHICNRRGFIFKLEHFESQAIDCFRDALHRAPNSAEPYFNIAEILRSRRQYKKATEYYLKAIAVDEHHIGAHTSLGKTYHLLRFHAAAERHFRLALADCSNEPHANLYLGELLIDRRVHLSEAHNCLIKAASDPLLFEFANRGIADCKWLLGDFEIAIETLDRLAHKFGNRARDWCTLALWLLCQRRAKDAEQKLNTAISNPQVDDVASLRMMRAVLRFIKHDIVGGWEDYQWREGLVSSGTRMKCPAWNGQSLSGRSILIVAEQGIGDTILFASMLQSVKRSARRVVVICHGRLVPVFQRSFQNIEFFSHSSPEWAHRVGVDVDFYCLIGNLGMYTRSTWESFEEQSTFIKPSLKIANALRRNYVRLAKGRPIIGVSWSSANDSLKHHKEAPHRFWSQLFDRKDALFINLQYGEAGSDFDSHSFDDGGSLYTDASVDQLRDMDPFVAQVYSVDCVVTISNTTVHVAGALGVKCFVVLNTAIPVLYTLFGEEATPWYKSVKFLRARGYDDWASVFDSVCANVFLTMKNPDTD